MQDFTQIRGPENLDWNTGTGYRNIQRKKYRASKRTEYNTKIQLKSKLAKFRQYSSKRKD